MRGAAHEPLRAARRGTGLIASLGAGAVVLLALSCNALLGNQLATLEDAGHREGATSPDAPSTDSGAPRGCDEGSRCVPSFTSDWVGPLVVAFGYGQASCPSGSARFGGHDLYDDPWDAHCGTCECSRPTPGCSYGVEFWTGPSCADGGSAMSCTDRSSGDTPGCFAIVCPDEKPRSWSLTVDGGRCTPAVSPTPTTPSVLCLQTSKGAAVCEAGGICEPTPEVPLFANVTCIMHGGKQTCPTGFPIPYGYGTSTRPCDETPCSCGQGPCAPTITPCSDTCTGTSCTPSGPPVSDGSCQVGTPASWSYTGTVSRDAGCPASGTLGRLVLTKPDTVCCTGRL